MVANLNISIKKKNSFKWRKREQRMGWDKSGYDYLIEDGAKKFKRSRVRLFLLLLTHLSLPLFCCHHLPPGLARWGARWGSLALNGLPIGTKRATKRVC